jgi:hypothetical protein
VPFYQDSLAETESQGDAEGSLTWIDEALALAGETGEHWSNAFLHRVRGEILRKRDPGNTAPAEHASRTAIGIAQQQKARSFKLRAALSLTKLGPTARRTCRARLCAQGLLAAPGISRDRGSVSAPQRCLTHRCSSA